MPADLMNLLPKYSPWPGRLLGIEPWEPKKKVAAEIVREFETEKWGPLWETVRQAGRQLTLAEVERLVFEDGRETMCWDAESLKLLTVADARRRQFEILVAALGQAPADAALVEIGAGWGQMVLHLALLPEFAGRRFCATEYTGSGLKVIEHLAQSHGISIATGRCDLSAAPITELALPENAVLYTSYSAHYVPSYTGSVVDELLALKPSLVVHFEPFYEHCDQQTLLGMLQRKYIETNDYNRNLLTVIREQSERRRVEIVTEQRQVFGLNPLLPMSVVAWRPAAGGR